MTTSNVLCWLTPLVSISKVTPFLPPLLLSQGVSSDIPPPHKASDESPAVTPLQNRPQKGDGGGSVRTGLELLGNVLELAEASAEQS